MRVCVFVETFEIFTYICLGRQWCDYLFPYLSYRQPLPLIEENRNRQYESAKKNRNFTI